MPISRFPHNLSLASIYRFYHRYSPFSSDKSSALATRMISPLFFSRNHDSKQLSNRNIYPILPALSNLPLFPKSSSYRSYSSNNTTYFYPFLALASLGLTALGMDNIECLREKPTNPFFLGGYVSERLKELIPKCNPKQVKYLKKALTNWEETLDLSSTGLAITNSEDAQKFCSALENWLSSHPHPFIHLKYEGNNKTLIQKLQNLVNRNKKQFQEKAAYYDCIRFAKLTYNKDPNTISEKDLGKGWEILTTSEELMGNLEEGYLGIAFINHQIGHIIIANRGTNIHGEKSNLIKDLWVDLKEVARQDPGRRQEIAIEFAKKVVEKSACKYRVGCSGHSLGGFIAQATATSLQNTYKERHFYAVCVDSPGFKLLIDQSYTGRYESRKKRDFVNFSLFPNLVNTCGIHEGSFYQIPIDEFQASAKEQSAASYNPFTYYHIKTHNVDHFLNAFQEKNPLSKGALLVQDWPLINWYQFPLLEKVTENKFISFSTFKQLLTLPTLLGNMTQDMVEIREELAKKNREFQCVLEELEKTEVAKNPENPKATLLTRFLPFLPDIFQSTTNETNPNNQASSSQSPESKKNTDSYALTHIGHYKVRIFDPQQIRLCHIPEKGQKLLRHFETLKNQKGDPEALKLFIDSRIKQMHPIQNLTPEDLYPLCNITIHEEIVHSLDLEYPATELARRAAMLTSLEGELTKCFSLANYLIFSTTQLPYLQSSSFLTHFTSGEVQLPKTFIRRDNLFAKINEQFQENGNIIYFHDEPGSDALGIVSQYCEDFKNEQVNGAKRNEKDQSFVLYLESGHLPLLKHQLLQFAICELGITFSDRDLINLPSIEEIFRKIGEKGKEKGPYLIIFNNSRDLEKIKEYIQIIEKYSDKKGKFIVLTKKNNENGNQIPISQFKIDVKHLGEATKKKIESLLNNPKIKESFLIFPFLIKMYIKYSESFDEAWLEGEVCAKATETSSPSAIADHMVKAIVRKSEETLHEEEREILRGIFTIASLMPNTEIEAEFMQSCFPPNKKIDGVLLTLEKHGILEKVDDGTFRCNPKTSQNLALFTEIDEQFFQIIKTLSKAINVRNIHTEEFEKNRKIRLQMFALLANFESSTGEKKEKLLNNNPTVEEKKRFANLIQILLAIGNNSLQDELYMQSHYFFQEAIDLCESNLRVTSADPIKDIVKQLATIDSALPNQYAKAYQLLWKNLFQLGEKSTHLERAIEINQEDMRLNFFKDYEKELTSIIFQRQGTGFILLESDQLKELEKAKKLYEDLYKLKIFGKMDSFHQSYCNLQLGKIYHKLGSGSIEGQHISKEEKREYYQKALTLLQEEKEKIIQEEIQTGKTTKDAKIAVMTLIGQILQDKRNPAYDFNRAESIFLETLELQAPPKSSKEKIKVEPLFKIYYSLALLYEGRIREHPYTKELSQIKNEKYLAKAQGAAQKAIQLLQGLPYEVLLGIKMKHSEKIDELSELLSRSL